VAGVEWHGWAACHLFSMVIFAQSTKAWIAWCTAAHGFTVAMRCMAVPWRCSAWLYSGGDTAPSPAHKASTAAWSANDWHLEHSRSAFLHACMTDRLPACNTH
jgi:hypothetical protein